MATCKGENCRLPMSWAISPNNQRIPLDARPYQVLVNSGIVKTDDPKIIRYKLEKRRGEYHAVRDDEAGTYVNHWQTCKDPPARRR